MEVLYLTGLFWGLGETPLHKPYMQAYIGEDSSILGT